MDATTLPGRLYEREMKPLGDLLVGRTQFWQIDLSRAAAAGRPNALQWPRDYMPAALLPTDDLATAVKWTRNKRGWFRAGVQLLPPFDWTKDRLPVPNTVGDVFVTPDGTVYRVADRSRPYVLGRVPPLYVAPPPQRRAKRKRKPAVGRRSHRDRERRRYVSYDVYEARQAKRLIAYILIFLMAAVVFSTLR